MIDWLIETSIAVTFLMLLVLAVRRPVAHFFGAGWAYALWALPALRLVLPPLHLLGDGFPSLLPSSAPVAVEADAALPLVADAGNALGWEPLLLAVWIGGAVLMVLWHSWRYLAFVRRLGIGSRVHASLAQEIGIIESAEVDGPLAIGLLDRWIVVPADFTRRYTLQEQRLALQHERTHHRREDIFWNMVALGVLALSWFNPVAYIAFRAFRTDQELSCDAVVAARASSSERHDYALALVKSASGPDLFAACPLNHAGQLKRRLKMMKAHRSSRLRALGGSGAVAALLIAGISGTESASIAAPEVGVPAVAPALPAAVAPPAQPAPAFVTPAPAQPGRSSKWVKTAKAEGSAPVARKKHVRRLAAAPLAVPAPAEPEIAPPPPAPPAPAHRVITVRLDGPGGAALIDNLVHVPRQMRLVRTEIHSVRQLDPEIKARLERILAARTGEARKVHLITVHDR